MNGVLRRWTGAVAVVFCLLGAVCARDYVGNADAGASESARSLQDRIDEAPAGAVLQLAAGTWDGNVLVTKSLTLRGAGRGGTVIRGIHSGYPVIRILTTGSEQPVEVLIESLCVAEAQGTTCIAFEQYENRLLGYRQSWLEVCPYGILVERSASVKVVDCLILHNRTGIAAIGSASLDIRDSEIRGNDWEGVYAAGTALLTVQDTFIVENGAAGVGLANEAIAFLTECVIQANAGDGVGIAEYAEAFLFRNTIAENGWSGVKLVLGAMVTMDANRILDNRGFGIVPLSGDCYPEEAVYIGAVFGVDNVIPGPEEPSGNRAGALCPAYPGWPWPEGFLSADSSAEAP